MARYRNREARCAVYVCVCVCGFVWGRGLRLQKDTNSVERKDNVTRFTTVALLFERFYLQSPCFKVQNVIQSTYLEADSAKLKSIKSFPRRVIAQFSSVMRSSKSQNFE